MIVHGNCNCNIDHQFNQEKAYIESFEIPHQCPICKSGIIWGFH